ncbi:3394_t:CDS:2, partial [Entrophospora sp. SA101]
MNEICVKLVDRYSEWVCKSIYSQPVLWIILTQKTIHENFIVPETEIRIAEFSKLGLVQFMNDEGETDRGRFVLSLRMDLDNGYQYWQHFEDLVARFHVLKLQLHGSGDNEEWLNWVADNDTETIIENELYDNDEGFINTSSNEINNLQNPSTPNKKRLL